MKTGLAPTMLSRMLPFLLLVFLLCTIPALVAAQTATQDTKAADPPVNGAAADSGITARVAGLSDEQVRRLLIDELRKSSRTNDQPATTSPRLPASPLEKLLDTLSSKSDISEQGARELLTAIPAIRSDLHGIFLKLCPLGTAQGAMKSITWVFVFLILALLIERGFKQLVTNRLFPSRNHDAGPPAARGVDKLFAGLVREIPQLIGIFLFFSAAYVMYITFIWTDSPNVQRFFLAILICVTIIRTVALLSRILFSPASDAFRLLPLDDQMARSSHRGMLLAFGYILVVFMSAVVARKFGAQETTIKLYLLAAASLLLIATAAIVLLYRTEISKRILTSPGSYGEEVSWGRERFASIWHLLAIAYLFLLWVMTFHGLIDPDQGRRGAFLLSFFVVPIWMICDKLMQWLVRYSMATLKIYQEQEAEDAALPEEDLDQRRQGKATFGKVMTCARAGLVIALLVWIASLWNINIPLFSNLSGVLFDTLVILAVAIFSWQLISNWIERKIREATPEEPEKKTEDEDDWGAAANRGRAYTLLPMLRKFIGTVLVTMVTMTVISSMGVDIGPLLAGAGVIGLAVGFGAQKLVADILSGFFYLLDDAFRVGEYVQAGGISGTVENISLRNVMLRHHRGMLQIVPHSELGAITNYMRGGIIVKFNLDFPYDADIDQIRKVIKKVGQSMLEDEAYSKDFIRPVKSQGVREITNSVMTIRVKFTAKPGAHFLIRREAYKRITEALRAKGIHYAHRKVIVDIPQQPEATKEQLAQAAGAAMRNIADAQERQQAMAPDEMAEKF